MPLETGNYVANLVATNPTSTDPKSAGDDHLRLIKTALLQSFAGFTGAILVTGTDGGAADAYTLTPATSLLAYGTRMLVAFSPVASNATTTPTLDISGLGAKMIKRVDGDAVAAGELASGVVYLLTYDGTDFLLAGPTKHYIDQLSFSGALPAQFSNGGKYLRTDGTSAYWAPDGDIIRREITSADTVTIADKNTLVDITSGTFTLSFSAAAILGDGFACHIRNAGSGDVTLDPNGSETIDGLASFVMYPGECRLILCDGSVLRSIVVKSFLKTFATSGTFIKPPGYTQFAGLLWGGGGSGRKSTTVTQGGGGGGCAKFAFPASALGATESVVIGAGGAAVTTNSEGNDGGTSTFAGLSAFGGEGGRSTMILGGNAYFYFLGRHDAISNSGTTLDHRIGYLAGGGGSNNIAYPSVYGGGAGGGIYDGSPYAAGTSVFGGAGGDAKTTTSGVAGTAPGGGGGGTLTGPQSGAGARGELRIWGVI